MPLLSRIGTPEMPKIDQDLLNRVAGIARRAGERILTVYETDFDVETKGDQSPVTEADRLAEALITEAIINEIGTDAPIVGEEAAEANGLRQPDSPDFWLVDPLDGTKEFIKRNGEFTVNIALVEAGIPTIGVVHVPAKQELFVGVSAGDEARATRTVGGEDDWSVETWLEEGKPIPARAENRPFTVVASRSHMSPETADYIKELKAVHGEVETLSKGSSLKLCMVAAGEADCYPRFAPTMEWDTAAGQGVCLAAGCDVLNWETRAPLTYNREELLNPWFLVRGPRMAAI